jgi:hypothetical protein
VEEVESGGTDCLERDGCRADRQRGTVTEEGGKDGKEGREVCLVKSGMS